MIEKHAFEKTEHGFGPARVEQAFTKCAGVASPELIELNELIVSFTNGRAEECGSAAKLEISGDETALLAGVDYGGLRRWAAQHGAMRAMDGGGIRAVVGAEFVLVEIYHQVDAATGQNALPSIRDCVLVIVKRRDERGQGRGESTQCHGGHVSQGNNFNVQTSRKANA